MPYVVEFTASALREFKALDRAIRRRIAAHINELAANPLAPGAKKLRGGTDLYRVRVGDYRVVYRVDGHRITVVVVKIGHRRDVYR
jgi:mRNA interferase RelE/StbE